MKRTKLLSVFAFSALTFGMLTSCGGAKETMTDKEIVDAVMKDSSILLDNKTNPSYSFNSGYISSTKAKNKTIYAQSPNIKFLFTYNLKLVKFAIVTVKSYIILT